MTLISPENFKTVGTAIRSIATAQLAAALVTGTHWLLVLVTGLVIVAGAFMESVVDAHYSIISRKPIEK